MTTHLKDDIEMIKAETNMKLKNLKPTDYNIQYLYMKLL